MVARWTFYDPIEDTTYSLEVNPNEGGSPERKKSFAYANTAAPDGKTLMFQGRDEPMVLSFSGVLLTQAQLDSFNTWFDKSHQILITDDLARTFWVVLTSFAPKRVRARSHPWKHTYQMSATIVDWESP